MLTVYVGDVKDLPRLEYDQLTEVAKLKARQAILDQERKALQRDINKTREQTIDRLVNNKYHISKLVRHSKHIRSLSNVQKLERHIIGNLCHFLSDGTYVTYFNNMVHD